MVYRAIGLMSGSSLDGLDIVFAEFHENGGKWSYDVKAAACYAYSDDWNNRLKDASNLMAYDYLLLHTEYGQYLGSEVNHFIEEFGLQYQVGMVASHGHTVFHTPGKRMTSQLGDGAGIAAATELPVITDLRALDVAFGGRGAPIVPIGEKLLLGDYDFYLNLGGIANISTSATHADGIIGFDVCAANRVLNMLAAEAGKPFDEDGKLAQSGSVNVKLLEMLNGLDYYRQPFPKSLANEFGTDTVFPIIKKSECSAGDALRTYCEHIAQQVKQAWEAVEDPGSKAGKKKMLVTGGGALNLFLVKCIRESFSESNLEIIIPDAFLIRYKEAIIMALIGVLRWREETNVLASVTGARRNSTGGVLWMGQED